MPLQKQNIDIPFASGLDTKTDPNRVPGNKFLSLQNSIFDTGGLLQKRNGFAELGSLPVTNAKNVQTYSGGLTAVGNSLYSYLPSSKTWLNSGAITPVSLSTTPIVRNTVGQLTVDSAVASNGLLCTAYYSSDTHCYYQISIAGTGQIVVPQVVLPSTAVLPRVFTLGNYFIVTFLATVSMATHLQFIAIPIENPTNPGAVTDLLTTVNALSSGYDGAVCNGALIVLAAGASTTIKLTYLPPNLAVPAPTSFSSQHADLVSIAVDLTPGGPGGTSAPQAWISWCYSGATVLYTMLYNYVPGKGLVQILAPTVVDNSAASVVAITSAVANSVLTIFYEIAVSYSYITARSDLVGKYVITYTQSTGAYTITLPNSILRGVAIASKAFAIASTGLDYLLVAYGGGGTYSGGGSYGGGGLEPTYFVIDQNGNAVAKLAFSNGGGYPLNQVLPQANVSGNTVTIGYLYKDLIQALNSLNNVTVDGVYSQTGINIANFTIADVSATTAEIAGALHLSGGFPWEFDGTKPVEHNFHLFPEDILVVPVNSGGSMDPQTYFYQICYEWTDSAGNIHRSAPSIPVSCTPAGMGANNSVTIYCPYYRITYKTGNNPVRLVIYRWSTAQQEYFQVTSITLLSGDNSQIQNDPTSNAVTYTDKINDADIAGTLLYTTGGLVEDTAGPATDVMTLFQTRLFLIDAEDKNLLWYSKQVIENTPVEFSDLFTYYVPPTIGAQGSTGDMKCLAAMDSYLLIFKDQAVYYITGTGPDNTGNNSDFSPSPTFVTSAIGCSNQRSIVVTPQGVMFQSTGKGIWLLGRDLSTKYIGAAVEDFNDAIVLSAVSVPETNQIRFTLDNGITLMYDYYYEQWGTFVNVPGISSCIYEGLHTFINSKGQAFQENPGSYVDGTSPVLMQFQTGWFSLAQLQGYQRAYFFYFLGQYLSAHKLNLQIFYDYSPFATQAILISPTNFAVPWGGGQTWGSEPTWGGASSLEVWRVMLQRQTCRAFQISVQELFDPTLGQQPGAGLTLSGINCVIGAKKGYHPTKASNTAG